MNFGVFLNTTLLQKKRDLFKNVNKRTCLVRKFHFNNDKTSKNHPVPVCTRTRRITVELITINGVKHIISVCDCCHVKHECNSCLHVKCALDLLPTLEFFHPKY